VPKASAEAHLFRPLGERRAGQGQLAIGSEALLPEEVSDRARTAADALHAAWNRLSFAPLQSLYAEDLQWAGPSGRKGGRHESIAWVSGLLTSLPASSLFFERVTETNERIALLWRLVADEGERRLWMRGSTIVTIAGSSIVEDDTVADEAALDHQRSLPLLDL
jgi:hypothetical protein